MCFSAEASFAVGAALVPAGAYCLRAALRKNARLLPVALMPFAFGAQQVAEGFVWLGIHGHDPARVRAASMVFLFFALAFWPWWMSVMNLVLETRPGRKRVFALLAVLTSVWFWVLYYPLLVGPESWLVVEVVHHSIHYSNPDLPVRQFVPQPILRALYLLSVAAPMALGPNLFGRGPLLVVVGSAAVAAFVFGYAFVSVWCFFAAALSVGICGLFYRLPAREPASVPPANVIGH